MATVTISRSGDRLIAIKQAGPDTAALLEHEADLLRRLQHPGIVTFVDLVETADGGRALHTEFVSSETWATRPLTVAAERAAGVALVATALADLHDLGVAHTRLSAEHVLHGDRDHPVICGLARHVQATPENRRADAADLASLCHDDVIEAGPLADKLASLAEECKNGQISPRELARRLHDPQARARQPQPPQPDPPDAKAASRPRRSLRTALLSALAAAAVAAVGLRLSPFGQDPAPLAEVEDPADETASAPHDPAQRAQPDTTKDPRRAASGDAAEAPAETEGSLTAQTPADRATQTPADSGADALTTEAPEAVGSPDASDLGRTTSAGEDRPADDQAPAAPPGRRGRAAHNGQATTVPPDEGAVASVAPAVILEREGRSYAVGASGDLVTVGDWDCDGIATPAIVRPSTGGVVLFNAWPRLNQSLSAPLRWRVQSPTDIDVQRHGECDVLRVYDESGSSLLD